MTWKATHVGIEGDGLTIGGLQVWECGWRSTGQSVELPHPSYLHQQHRYGIYEIGDEQPPVRFAAAELSNGVYGFYVPA